MNRRQFLAHISAVLGSAAVSGFSHAAASRPCRILLRSSWQTVNIGDIGHTPGVITLLQEYLPAAEITLWPGSIDNGVEEMLRRNFPKLKIVQGEGNKQAIADCDFLLHGSGPSLVAQKDVAKWRKAAGKPYGIYGITVGQIDEEAKDILNNACFVFFRDSVSLNFAKEQGVKCPVMEFGPDGAFGVKLRNDEAAVAFLKKNGLEDGKFLCCIPRLRYTPYWKIKGKPFDEKKNARNEEMKEHDHAPLRDAICAVTRQTAMKVLLCPEDKSHMEIGREMLFDKLPEDVQAKVVWRENYWLTDEALSTYVRSAGLFGLEMHSPIMCIGNGIPAIVCRFEEQTSKGIMWRDIGLGDWLFNMDSDSDVKKITPAVLGFAQDPAAARTKVAKAQEFVRRRQRETMAILEKSLPKIL